MNPSLAELLRGYASSNEWLMILPEILLGLLALGLLAAEMALPPGRRAVVGRIAVWGQLLIFASGFGFCRACYTAEPMTYFSGLIAQDDITQLMRGFFLLSSILVCYLGHLYLARRNLPRTEFFHLVILIAAGLMLLVQSANFVMLFVALETVTVAFYVLVAYCRTSSLSLESGIKYLILGALSSSILLFGIVLLYGIAGSPVLEGSSPNSLGFPELAAFIRLHPENLVVRTGALLVIAGICFKIGAFPFQIWVPDVYQGAPTPVTAYLAVASKAAGFIVLLNLLAGPFAALRDFLLPLLSAIAVLTILFGNLAAVVQNNVKRLMGLSGIAHAGYLLVGLLACFSVEWAPYAVVFYLLTYLLGSFAVFGVMSAVADENDDDQDLADYSNLSRERPFLAGVLACGLGSLAGIPPFAGFIGKLFIFVAAFQAGLYGLLGVAIVGVVISIYYYFGWVREAWFSTEPASAAPAEPAGLPLRDRLVLGALVAATVVFGLYPGIFPIVR